MKTPAFPKRFYLHKRRRRQSRTIYDRARHLSEIALQAPHVLLRGNQAERLAWGRLLTEEAATLSALVGKFPDVKPPTLIVTPELVEQWKLAGKNGATIRFSAVEPGKKPEWTPSEGASVFTREEVLACVIDDAEARRIAESARRSPRLATAEFVASLDGIEPASPAKPDEER